MDKSLIAALLLFPCVALGQTHTLPGNNVVPSGATLTLQSGSTTDFNAGATVDFTGATVTGLGAGSGTVTSFSAGNLSPLFTTSVATATTTPALTFSLSTAGAHTFLGNETASTAAPHYVQPAFTDLSGTATDAQVPDSHNQTAMPNLTSNGFVKTSGGVGTLSIDTASYQPLDGDLTSLSGAAGTNTIYYRSAADTWSAVTIGANMTFSAGTLNSVAGGAGTVTTTGSPATGNLTKFSGATSITNADLTGDVTTSGGVATTLAAGNAGNLNSGTLLAARMPALTGDVTTTAGAVATTIANDAVTFAKFQNITDVRLLGRNAGSAGDMQEITLGTNLSFTGTTLNAAGGGGGTPGGSTTQVQYNNAGAFGGITNATSDGTTMTLTSPKIITSINDTNANELLKFTATGSAVNEFTVANAATGNSPTLSATGGDTNVSISLAPQGTGSVGIGATTYAGNTPKFIVSDTTDTLNVVFQNTATTARGSPLLTLQAPLTTAISDGKAFSVVATSGGTAESFSRGMFYTDGSYGVGPGSSTRDTFLDRSASNTFRISSDRSSGLGNLVVNGGIGVGTSTVATGVVNANVGFRIAGAAPGNYELTGNGTNFIAKASDIPNGSSAQQTGFTADTYLAGSVITVNAGDFTVGANYRCTFDMAKTGGTATPIVTIRVGTAGTTSDTAVQTITWAAGTNVADTGTFEIRVNFRAVGASATVASFGQCNHNLAATGLTSTGASGNGTISNTTSSTFNSTAATKIGISFNGGASFGGTNNVVQAYYSQP
jgi:hypothetical protein